MPEIEASQGHLYTYQLAAMDPAGGIVSFLLTTAPSGAVLDGNTLTWTPTPSQSRTSNSFSVTAKTPSEGSATQSWTVTPSGTITVNWVDTYWSPGGPVAVPAAASSAFNIQAMVVQSDGSIVLLPASATSTPGVFTVADVPAGNYWLTPGREGAFWTSTGSFDAGRDIGAAQIPFTKSANNTSFDFNVSGVAPSTSQENIQFFTDPPFGGLLITLPPESSNLTSNFSLGTSTDWSQISTAFLLQYEPETLGSQNIYVLGPELTLSNLTLQTGGANLLSVMLNSPTPSSIDLSVSGSQWASVFSNIGPAPATVQDSVLTLTAQPYVLGVNASPSTTFLPALVLVAPSPGGLGVSLQGFDPLASICSDFTGQPGGSSIPIDSPILSDAHLGVLQYNDPFESKWTRALALCQQATLPIPIPNSADTYSFLLVDGESAVPSNLPLAPLAMPVQNPSINGASFFASTTLNTTSPSLEWTEPGGAAPYGYKVRAYLQTTLNGTPVFEPIAAYTTNETSMVLPPLLRGNTYIFSITTEVDGAANVQTAPFRSALPTGFSSVVSAPITISPSALAAQIRGDLGIWRRLVSPSSDRRELLQPF